MKGVTFRRVPAPQYDLPPLLVLTKKRLREIAACTKRQCRNGGSFDRPSITSAELLSLLHMLEESERKRREDLQDITGTGKR